MSRELIAAMRCEAICTMSTGAMNGPTTPSTALMAYSCRFFAGCNIILLHQNSASSASPTAGEVRSIHYKPHEVDGLFASAQTGIEHRNYSMRANCST